MHVLVPALINHLSHYVLEHPAHHVSAAIPHYNLKKAQAELAKVADPSIFTVKFSFANMSDALRRCRLYDYDEHVWIDFEGNVTAIPVETAESRRKAEAGKPFEDLVTGRAGDGASPGIFFPATPNAAEAAQDVSREEVAKP